MLVSDFQYRLPPELIAQEPLPDRAASRLLRVDRRGGTFEDRQFRELPSLLRPDDLLVVNNTRVFPARLFGQRSGQRAQPISPHNPAAPDFLRGRIEVLLTRQIGDDPNSCDWDCLVRPGRKIGVGEKLYFSTPGASSSPDGDLEAEVIARGQFGERRIRFAPTADLFARIERLGHVPLPPYIDRADRATDRHRYNTVYAHSAPALARSVAAPTAGLHFTPEILEQIRRRGIETAEITLHVGLGTFQPIRVEKVEDHKLHRERFEISPAAAQAISRAKAETRRVVAVGTTTVRTLEYAAREHQQRLAGNLVPAQSGEADLFIYPGFQFKVVDALLTNFHLPQSTLLMLVCAFGGQDFVLNAYRHAVEAGYRFYSYGDCMFLD
jgi:S-adenosylmethionine:tRNA ribosyltransferase-isomerase